MPYKILYIQGVTVMGGAPRSLQELAAGLDRSRFSPLILTGGEGQFTQELAQHGLEYRTLRIGMWRKARSFPRIPWVLYQIYSLIKRHRIDLVHANTQWDNPYGVIPARWCHIPAVCHIRTLLKPDMVRKYFLNRASYLITNSEEVRRSLGDSCTAPCVTIYPGVDIPAHELSGGLPTQGLPTQGSPTQGSPTQGSPTQARERIRASLGFTQEQVVVGIISRLEPLKGQELLIQAAKTVVAHCPETRFLIVGDDRIKPGHQAVLQSMVEAHGLTPYFVFTGYRSDIRELTAALDISVLPSYTEGFGRGNLEAMALGKPVISSQVGGIPEVVEDRVTGYLIPPGDAQALAEKLLLLVGDRTLRERLGRQGRRQAKEKFSQQRQVTELERLYRKLLEGAA